MNASPTDLPWVHSCRENQPGPEAGNSSKASQKAGYYQHARPDVQALVPRTARRVLDVGCGEGYLGVALKARQPVEVTGVECVPEVASTTATRLDRVITGDIEAVAGDLPQGYYDCIILADVLEHLPRPEVVLKALRSRLSDGGAVVASIPNVRHWSVLKDLLEGRWEYTEAGILDRTHLRFFTRSSIARLFDEAGYAIRQWQGVTVGGELPYGTVKALSICGFDTRTLAEESVIYQYLVVAEPVPSLPRVSIVILTYNQLDYTRRCVESLWCHTSPPFEVIFVDNGSTDGTPAYLEELAGRHPEARLIANPQNRGFAAGCNQGLQVAQGAFMLLLNNDVLVTPGWLDRMLAAFKADASIGLVGPRTNAASGQQCLPEVPYGHDPEAMESFARQRALSHAGRGFYVNELSGFCLLIKREVIERIGGLDPRFGVGNFEDNDFCLRARLAGYRLWVADDVFIHHFAGRSFLGAKLDYQGILAENWEKFKAKWRIDPGTALGQPVAVPLGPNSTINVYQPL